MRSVFLFTDSLGAGGAQRQLVNLAILLKQQSYNVKVVTYHDIPFYRALLEDNGVRSQVIPRARKRITRVFCIANYFKSQRPDCLIAFQESPSFIACVARLLGCSFHLIVSERNVTQSISFFDMVRFHLFRFADWIVPNSFTQTSFLINRYPCLKDKVFTITNYVDTESFSKNGKARINVIPTILCVGRLSEQKNVIKFLEAVSITMSKLSSPFFVRWVGGIRDSLYYEECLKRIQYLGLNDCFILTPETADISKFYYESDIFCLPSLWEGFPNALCEAMSCSMPVICSNICDNPMIVGPSNSSFLFDPTNPEDIADKIIRILSLTSEEREVIGKRNRGIAVTSFSKDIFTQKFKKIIENDSLSK